MPKAKAKAKAGNRPMLCPDGLEKNNVRGPIKALAEYYEPYFPNNYYTEMDRKSIKEWIPAEADDALLKYMMCRPDSHVAVRFGAEGVEKLKSAGELLSYKVKVSRKQCLGIFFQVLIFRGGMRALPAHAEVEKMADEFGIGADGGELAIHFYESAKRVKGRADILQDDSHDEFIMLAKMFLNPNTFRMLAMQDLENLYRLAARSDGCVNQLLEFMRDYWKLTYVEQNNVILTSGGVLFIYGLRNCSDIDVQVLIDNKLNDKYNAKVFTKHAKLKKIYKGQVIDQINHIILDPNNYFYFVGVKATTLKVEMNMRSTRTNRPRAFVDIIISNEKYGTTYRLPIIDPQNTEFPLKKDFYKLVAHFMKERYDLKVSDKKAKALVIKYYTHDNIKNINI